MTEQQGKEDSKQGGCQHTALFYPTFDFKGAGQTSVELDGAFHVGVEGFDQLGQFRRAANFGQELEEAVSADEVECLCQIDEGDVQWSLLFPAFLLQNPQ